MQKEYFRPEENTKPSHCNYATFYTKNFLLIFYLFKVSLNNYA